MLLLGYLLSMDSSEAEFFPSLFEDTNLTASSTAVALVIKSNFVGSRL
jgi:hypothetical protein